MSEVERKPTKRKEQFMRKKNNVNVLEFIPRGKENAITRAELVEKIGLDDRTVRELIHDKRTKGEFIISSTSGKGYYLPEKREEMERFINQQKSYIKNLQRSISKAERDLKTLPEQTALC